MTLNDSLNNHLEIQYSIILTKGKNELTTNYDPTFDKSEHISDVIQIMFMTKAQSI